MRHVKRIAFAWLQGWLDLLMLFPIVTTVYVLLPIGARQISLPPFPIWLAVISLFYLAGFLFASLMRSLRFWLAALSAAVPLFCAWLLNGRPAYVFAAIAVLWTVAWIRGMMNRLMGFDRLSEVGLWWMAIVCYFAASFVYPRFDLTQPYAPWVNALGIAALALTLYRSNNLALVRESMSEDGEESGTFNAETKRRNRLLVTGLIVLILTVSVLPAIAAAVKQAHAFLSSLIFRVLSGPADGSDPQRPEGQLPETGGLAETGETSMLAAFFGGVLYVLAILVLAALAAVLAIIIGKRVARWVKRILEQYRERAEDEEADPGYEDEKQSLFEGAEAVRERVLGWRRRIMMRLRKEPDWDELSDNRERVRSAYRRLLLMRMLGGYIHDEARTPRETGQALESQAPLRQDEASAIRMYESVRYGGKDVSDEQAARIKTLFRRGRSRR